MNPLVKPLLLSILIISCASCAIYERYQLPKPRLMKINQDNLAYYLIDAAHPLSRVWYMSECQVKPTEISGFFTKMTEAEATEISLLKGRLDARWSKDDVLFYADPRFAAALQDTFTMALSVDNLEKIEVYELNHAKTFGRPLLSITGGLLFLYFISEVTY